MTKVLLETKLHEAHGRRWHVGLERKVEDLWIGVFWNRTRGAKPVWNVWITIIPCFPIHVFIQTGMTP